MLLSRFPLRSPELHGLPSNAGRNFVSASVHWINAGGREETLTLGTFHFDTRPGDKDIRSQQARTIGSLCQKTSIVGGDTNVKGDMEPLPFGLVDAWLAAHPMEPGFTRGPGVIPVNVPQNWTSADNARMDRIYLRGAVRVENCRLVAAFPQVSSCGQRIWASDHAGVVATILLSPGV
eukprot:TRINITY_DN41340_c0_g1_i2.p1 TRINITY_DN41340_c0_g1~~TRINITY_DN41340_c0_g1_i2.p1  ORF type:complete len:178 (+),score=20.04 TRINITY_DN41340_c0_g1_i2:201-734(+)